MSSGDLSTADSLRQVGGHGPLRRMFETTPDPSSRGLALAPTVPTPMRLAMRGRNLGGIEAGFSLVEMAVVMLILAIMTVLATPLFLTYYQSSRLRAAAEEVASIINQGRQLGIRENTGTCVHIGATSIQYRLGSTCAGGA